MKKILVPACALIFLASLVFAQPAPLSQEKLPKLEELFSHTTTIFNPYSGGLSGREDFAKKHPDIYGKIQNYEKIPTIEVRKISVEEEERFDSKESRNKLATKNHPNSAILEKLMVKKEDGLLKKSLKYTAQGLVLSTSIACGVHGGSGSSPVYSCWDYDYINDHREEIRAGFYWGCIDSWGYGYAPNFYYNQQIEYWDYYYNSWYYNYIDKYECFDTGYNSAYYNGYIVDYYWDWVINDYQYVEVYCSWWNW